MPTHKSRIALVFALAIWGHAGAAAAASLTLAWNHSADSNTAGYQISYGTQPGTYTTSVRVGYVVLTSLSNLNAGATYYLVVQSYDGAGTLGPPTNELAAQVPLGAPTIAITCPSPVLSSGDGNPMAVTLTPSVSGGVSPITSTCSPPSGSLFSVGTTSFGCTATDAIQQRASCTSQVVVLAAPGSANAPLSITCPTIPMVTASGNSGKTIVKFADPTYSGGTAPVTTSCAPKSGSKFDVGTTSVTCQAVDAARQVAACTTQVTVNPANGRLPR